MTRITPEHLSRAAWVYVRQSTPSQVRHNHESRGRQYALKDRARQLGWSDVVLVDDDLGRSGGGTERPGYDRLLAAVCRGEVGAVLSLEASRLARNGREWHTLIDYCGLVGCLLADETCVYDPRLPDDRLLLGMKGAMSEMELSTLRFRSVEALRRKARRGELFMTVAVGYVRVDRDRIGMDPDQRVRETVALVFRKFAEFGSIRQVHLWLCQEGVELPAVVFDQSQRRVVWKLPGYTTVHRILTNPVYAGAYAFGRTGSRTYIGERTQTGGPWLPARAGRVGGADSRAAGQRFESARRLQVFSLVLRDLRSHTHLGLRGRCSRRVHIGCRSRSSRVFGIGRLRARQCPSERMT